MSTSWTGLSSTAIPNLNVLKDAVDNDYLQGTILSGDSICRPESDTAMWFTNDGSLTSTTRLPTKSEVEAARLWDPSSEEPSGLTATTAFAGVSLSWNDDADVPSTDGGWARNQVETVIFRNSSSSFSGATEIFARDYGTTSYTDGDKTSGYWYYWIRYRNKEDGSMTGPLVGPEGAQAGDGSA